MRGVGGGRGWRVKDEEKRGGDTAKRRKRGRKPGRGTSPASTEKKDQAEIDIEGERERGSERESSGFIQATKKVPAMKNLDNNLHRRAAQLGERLRRIIVSSVTNAPTIRRP